MTVKKEEKAALVTPVQPSAVATYSPSAADGFFDDQEAPQDKLIVPRIKLLQSNSTEVTEDGAKIGTYLNNITKDNYGESLQFIPVKFTFGALLITLEDGMKCRSADGITSIFGDKCVQCPFGEYYKNWRGKIPAKCGETIEAMGLIADTLQPCVVSFRSTSYPAGKKLLSSAKLMGKLRNYVLGSTIAKNDKGRFFVMDIKSSMDVSLNQLEEAVKWKNCLKEKKVQIHDDELAKQAD